MNRIFLITLLLLIPSALLSKENVKEKKIAKYVMENIQKDYLNCYSFYKVAAESLKKTGKQKEIILGLEKSAIFHLNIIMI